MLRILVVDRGDGTTPSPPNSRAVRVATHDEAVAAALAGTCDAVVLRDGGDALGCVARLAGHAVPVIVLLEEGDPAEFARAGAAASLPHAAATPELLECVLRHAMAARQVIAREEGCRHLLELLREAVLVQSGGVVAYANAAAAAMLGLPGPDGLLGRAVADLFHPELRERAAEYIRAAAAGERALPAHERLLGADGAAIDVEITAGAVEYAGKPSVLIVARDIRERLRLEEQLRLAQRMEAVGRLAGGVAHDFNNLLTTIKGNADLLSMDIPPDSPSVEDVAEIQSATVRAAALTRQLLAFGRGQILVPRVLDLNAALSAALPMLRRLVPEKVEVATVLDPGISPVHADPQQLDQVLVNLALNARDAMPHGGTLRLVTTNAVVAESDPRPAYMAAGEYVRLSVSDDGHGMDDATRQQVFEPFFTTRGPGKGAGLGLATVYGIVKQSGGYITVESELGRGTTFHILLPRVTDTGPAADAPPELAPATARGTVLLVEDEDPVRRVTARALFRRGFGVLEARDGREALALWEEHGASVDMVLTDLVMPHMGGEELARHLNTVCPALPILFMTGYTRGAALNREALGPGAEVVHKPFDADELAERIARMLER
jgi:PAS domain S-box-containing protein